MGDTATSLFSLFQSTTPPRSSSQDNGANASLFPSSGATLFYHSNFLFSRCITWVLKYFGLILKGEDGGSFLCKCTQYPYPKAPLSTADALFVVKIGWSGVSNCISWFKLYFLVRRFKATPLLLLLCQPAAKFKDQVKAVIITMMKWILLGKLKLQCRLMCIDKVLINVMIL